MKKDAAPTGYTTVTPYLVVKEVEPLMKFLSAAFDAEEVMTMPGEDGRIRHAEMRIGNAMVMMGAEMDPERKMEVMLYLYTEDTDKYYNQALAAGGTSAREPEDQFYGDRTAAVKGPMDNIWYIAHAVENVSAEEIKERMKNKQ